VTVTPWHWPETVGAYDDYTRRFPMYRQTSQDLVRLAGIGPGDRCVDLGCGTGVTVQAIVDRVGGDGWVTAVDSSAAMLAAARRNVTAANVTWRYGHAENVDTLCDAPVDWVVSNMAFWQFETGPTLRAVGRLLRPRGRLVFSDAHRATRHAPYDPRARDKRWTELLSRNGYAAERILHRTYRETAESLAAWTSMPLWTVGAAGMADEMPDTGLLLSASFYVCHPRVHD
jgi:ubiquinone/menaquinone biosynthesis C-methylase UbiE